MRMSRKMGLLGSRTPSLEELFSSISYAAASSKNGAAKTTTTLDMSNYTEGIYYVFFTLGSSLEVSRLVNSATGCEKTQVFVTAETDSAKREITVSGRTIGFTSCYAYHAALLMFNSTFNDESIFSMLSGCSTELLGSYNSQYYAADADVRVAKSAITANGVIYTAFRPSSSNFSFTKAASLSTVIFSRQGSTIIDVPAYIDDGTYLLPANANHTASSATSLRDFTMYRLC